MKPIYSIKRALLYLLFPLSSSIPIIVISRSFPFLLHHLIGTDEWKWSSSADELNLILLFFRFECEDVLLSLWSLLLSGMQTSEV